MDEWAPGEVVLGLYEVLEVVRSGGMGLVHRVRHRGWQVDMAVKTPRPEQFRTQEDRDLFVAEAGTWVGLGLHPHTVNCVYVRTIDDVPRVFAEWVDGGSVAQAVASGHLYAGLALARVLDIAVQTAWGLAHAHAGGLVHQDVKPANVMLAPDGTAKVTDFGLAKARTRTEALARDTVTFGGMTLPYRSPEQAAAARNRDIRLTTATDVWSWAVTLLEMFAGHRVSDHGQAAGARLEELTATRLPIPPALKTLLRRCFTEDPAARPPIAELAATLAELYGELTGRPYERPVPQAAQLLSDGLSNQALSLLDLGRTEEAEQLWRRAMGADPHHLPTVYNFGLHRWRSGVHTGEELVTNLEAARVLDTSASPALGALLLGSVQLERHEDERAGELLREAAAADPGSADAATALAELARRRPRVFADLDEHAKHVKKSVTGTPVAAVATSADGGLVLSGDGTGRLLLWTPAEKRRAVRTLTKRGPAVTDVAMDAAGSIGAVVWEDGDVELWDLAAGRQRPLPPRPSGALSVAVSGDAGYVAFGFRSGLILVWDHAEQRTAAALGGHAAGVSALALSWNGDRVVSASFRSRGGDGDGTVNSWDVFSGVCLATLVGPERGTLHGRPVRTFPMDLAALSTDARYAVVAWWRGPLALWDAVRRATVSERPHHWQNTTVGTAAIAGPGPTVLTAGDVAVPVQAWDPRTGRSLRTLDQEIPLNHRTIQSAAVSADGRVAVLGSAYGKVMVRSLPDTGYQAPWCYARPRQARELTSAADVFCGLVVNADSLAEQGRFAAAAQELRSAQQVPGFARHPDLRAGWARVGPHGRRSTLLGAWPLYEFDGDHVFTKPTRLAMRDDGLVTATGRWRGEIDVWNFIAGERLHVFDPGEGGNAEEIQFAVGGQLVVVLTSKGAIRRLNPADGSKRIFTDEMGAITAFTLNLAGDRILVGDATGTLRLRDLPRGAILHTMRAHGGKVYRLAMSPDTRFAATLGGNHPEANHFGRPLDENEIQLWALDADRPLWTLSRRSHLERMEFSADGETLFLAEGLLVDAYDVRSGKRRYSVRTTGAMGGMDTVIAFSGDRGLAAIPDREGLRVFETATAKTVQSMSLRSATGFALSADGSFAVTGGFDRLVRVWDVRTGKCLRTLEGHRSPINQVVLNRDGTLLASADLGSALWAWELAWDYDFPAGGDR